MWIVLEPTPSMLMRANLGLRPVRDKLRQSPILLEILLVCWVVALDPSNGQAADLTADEVRGVLTQASVDNPADFSGKDLSDLDLSNLDFKRANLTRANLFATRLVLSNLAGANLN